METETTRNKNEDRYLNIQHSAQKNRVIGSSGDRVIYAPRNNPAGRDHPISRSRRAGSPDLSNYSWRNACTGSSLAARDAGYSPAERLTSTEKPIAASASHKGTYQKFCGLVSTQRSR